MGKILTATALTLLAATPLLAAPRGVVAELFTATWWTYCPWADAALGKMADEKGLTNWVPVAWHSSGTDPYYTNESRGRMSYYAAGSYPTCVLDGTERVQVQTIKRTFTLGAGWNKANLGVSAFVQKFATREILNGRATKLVEGVAVEPTSLGRVKTLYR